MNELTHTELKSQALDMLRDEKNPGKVRAWLVFHGGLNENEARKAVSSLLLEAGLEVTTKRTNWPEVVRTIRENRDVETKLLAQMVSEASGCKVSSARHYISHIAMCEEWSRQESEV